MQENQEQKPELGERRAEQLAAAWKREEKEPFSGWDFSYLNERMLEELPPWSYMALATRLMGAVSSVMDMGTGGGERLLEFKNIWPQTVVATEDYAPNIKLAKGRLAPLGVQVKEVPLTRHGPMPFADGEFDLVLNRHSGFNAQEVARILAPGGTFLTQQVDGRWAQDLIAAFDAEPQWPDATLANSVSWLKAAGFAISVAEEWSGKFTFADVGAIVYYLKAVPWLVPGFSVDRHLDHLMALQNQLEAGDELRFEARKFLIKAQKPL
jgi:SAM-dependent methyltransferase